MTGCQESGGADADAGSQRAWPGGGSPRVCRTAARSSQTTNVTAGLLVKAVGSTRRVIIRGSTVQARSGSGRPRRRAAAQAGTDTDDEAGLADDDDDMEDPWAGEPDPIGFQKWATGPDLDFYAARSYSLMRPPTRSRGHTADEKGASPAPDGIDHLKRV